MILRAPKDNRSGEALGTGENLPSSEDGALLGSEPRGNPGLACTPRSQGTWAVCWTQCCDIREP